MTPGERDSLVRQLHELEVKLIEQIARLAGKIDNALTMGKTVDDHETRIRELEKNRRPAWRDIGFLIATLTSLSALASSMLRGSGG